jgi:cation diffusion facilitator family transporter
LKDIRKSSQAEKFQSGMRTSVFGLTINFFLSIIKLAAGWLGNSHALVADGMESAGDMLNSLVIWFGLKIASKARDHDHPYGHGKAEPLATMIVSIGLIAVSIFIAVESMINIRQPHHLPMPFTLLVLLAIIIIKEFMFRYTMRVSERIESSAVKADAWHHRSDMITSLAAFAGISIALIGGQGYEAADDWAALVSSLVIFYNGSRLLVPALNEVMDTAPSPELLEDIRNIAKEVDGVVGLDKSYIRKMGLEYYVDLHVVVDGNLPVRDGHKIAHKVKDAILHTNPRIADVLIHIEPYTEAASAINTQK